MPANVLPHRDEVFEGMPMLDIMDVFAREDDGLACAKFSWRRRTNVLLRDVRSQITINKRTTMRCTVTASTCMFCSCGAETGDAVWEFACQRHSKNKTQ